jgi:hypothetical protein
VRVYIVSENVWEKPNNTKKMGKKKGDERGGKEV